MLDKLIRDFITAYDKSNFGLKDKIFFFKELGHLIQGGVGILDAVNVINANTDNYALKAITAEVAADLKAGKSLSQALMKHVQYFDDGDIAILQSGEKSGKMGEVLQALAREYHFIAKIKSKYTSALMYPMILLTLAVGAIIALFTFILPSVFRIVEQFPNIHLPAITRILQEVSTFFVTKRMRILLGGGFTVLFLIIVFSTGAGQVVFFSLLFQIPLLGNIIRNYYLIKFSRYAKIMLEAGIDYVETFRLLKSILGIPLYEKMLDTTLSILVKGGSVHEGLEQEPMLIPSTVVALIKAGEKVGALSSSFGTVIEIYEEELETHIGNLSKLIEPILMVLIGGVVVLVSVGVFGIITTIMDAVKI